jgi:type II secretory ATPase GspE/PulE/Tfp pilus assembly ATPase PilB-like protein
MKSNIDAFQSSLPDRVAKKTTPISLYQNVGCGDCVGGFSGRVGVFELIPLDDEFETVLDKEANEVRVKKLARSKGMVSMQEDGVLKALSGITTLEEVEKQTGAIKWPKPTVE